jgi:hypothetical protein
MRPIYCACLFLSIILAGCQTAPGKSAVSSKESGRDVADAVGQVAGALSGQDLTDEQKKKLVNDIRKDKEAQSALRSIAGAMDIKQAAVKYCPVDGKRFSPDHDICPVHKVKLEELVD